METLRVLLIEDDPIATRSIKLILTTHDILCDSASIGIEGLEVAKITDYDLIILDLLLPDVDGYEVLLRLRAAKVKTPVLILSSLTSSDRKTQGFNLGADDYMTKPFDKDELVARIKAIVRRSRGISESFMKFGKVTIDLDYRSVEVDGKPLRLTNSEYLILHLLATRKGTVVSKEMFLSRLYGNKETVPDVKIVDVFVCKLRKKLFDASGGINYIETIWGKGHMLHAPETT